MARLPTVKLVRRHKGRRQTRVVNRTAYTRDIASYVSAGWKILSERRGDASDAVVDFARRQDIKEMARERNPKSAASDDAQRRWLGKQSHKNINTRRAASGPTGGTDT